MGQWTNMGHTDGHGTYGRTWDIRTDMGHTDGHGTYGRTYSDKGTFCTVLTLGALAAKLEDGHGTCGRTWDIRTDMGHTDGHIWTKGHYKVKID